MIEWLFCKRYEHCTVSDWEKVLFSDETSIKRFSNAVSSRVRHPEDDHFNPRYRLPKTKHGASTMILGSMAASGRGNLWFLPKGQTMAANNYLQVLEERLLPMMAISVTCYFIQDGATKLER